MAMKNAADAEMACRQSQHVHQTSIVSQNDARFELFDTRERTIESERRYDTIGHGMCDTKCL